MEYHPIKGGGGGVVVEIPLVASCNRNKDERRPNGPLDSYSLPLSELAFPGIHLIVKKITWREEAKEHLTKGRSSIPGSGIPSD